MKPPCMQRARQVHLSHAQATLIWLMFDTPTFAIKYTYYGRGKTSKRDLPGSLFSRPIHVAVDDLSLFCMCVALFVLAFGLANVLYSPIQGNNGCSEFEGLRLPFPFCSPLYLCRQRISVQPHTVAIRQNCYRGIIYSAGEHTGHCTLLYT